MEHLGDRLKAVRKLRGLKQSELGEKIGITGQAVSVIESSGSTRDETLVEIVRHLKVSKEWLKDGVGTPPEGILKFESKLNYKDSSWKDEAYKLMETQLQKADAEIQWLRKTLDRFMPPGSFLKSPKLASASMVKVIPIGARLGDQLGNVA